MTRIRRQDVLRYLKLQAKQLFVWERTGLISKRDSYNMEDCGRLRALRDISAARISSSSICASVGAMQSVAGMENPLLDARPVIGGKRLQFRHRGAVTDPIARQYVFDFGPDASIAGSDAAIIPIGTHQPGCQGRISEMFLEAVQYEDNGEFDQASAMYERILARDPNHPPTCINLGTICYNRRQFTEAEKFYRRATQADPEYALAFFDLGNALDELKRLPDSIAAYQAAICLVPTYADAHYNLALAFERVVERRMALRHWSAYLKLDTTSRWAAHARRQVRKILDREGLSVVHRSPPPAHPTAVRLSARFGESISTA